MGPLIGAALIQGAGSLLSSLQDTYLTNKQMENQRDLLAEQREWDLAQWHRQNEYNSPASQMERFEAAGLNPNLMYDQGNPGLAGTIQTSAGQAPAYKPTPNIGDTTAFINMFRAIKDSEKIQSEIDLNDELKNKVEEEANHIEAQTKGVNLQNSRLVLGASAFLKDLKRQEKLSDVEIARLDNLINNLDLVGENEMAKLSASTAQFNLSANESARKNDQVDVLGMPAQNELTSLLVNVIKNPDDIGDQFNTVIKKYAGTWFGQFIANLGEYLGIKQKTLTLPNYN